jgi:hypothetical protein
LAEPGCEDHARAEGAQALGRRRHRVAVFPDPLQLDGRDAEVRVAELALDAVERHVFAGHLDGVCTPELVRREAPMHTRADGEGAQRRSDGGG